MDSDLNIPPQETGEEEAEVPPVATEVPRWPHCSRSPRGGGEPTSNLLKLT